MLTGWRRASCKYFANKDILNTEIQNAKNLGNLNNDWDLTEFLLKQHNIIIEKEQIIDSLDWILHTAIAKQKNKEYGFITLFTDSKGNYWYKVSRGFSTALAESHASLETLIEENIDFTKEDKNKINESLRKVNKFYS